MIRAQLRSFHAVAREGGFTAASHAINVGQPTISTQIKALETDTGSRCFIGAGARYNFPSADYPCSKSRKESSNLKMRPKNF